MIETALAEKILLITAETYSKFINSRDCSVRTVFGDGAAATLISSVEVENELIGPFVFGTDGHDAKELIVPAGGLRQPLSQESAIEKKDKSNNWRSEQNIYMNGQKSLILP